PYYTVLLGQECGMTLEHSASADELVFTAVAAAA
ncbi:histidine phosphotransferase, partial [Rhizobium ruizarguesonis]